MADFAVKFTSVGDYSVKFTSDSEFQAAFGNFQTVTTTDRDYYEGMYEITPQIKDQKFITAGKTMKDDLTVKAIPYAEVSNNYGGMTVTIGG